GGREVLCAVVRDNTERKRREQVRLREQEELEHRVWERTAELARANEALEAEIADRRLAETKYRGIFENAIEGIFQTTPDGHYLSANPALARIYGYRTPEELI